jgi:hypothetical protein
LSLSCLGVRLPPFLVVIGVALAPALARAQSAPPPAVAVNSYSQYEQETIRGALETLRARVDPVPENKIVEGIDVLTLEVIEQRDPVPGFVNIFHATTRHWVIDQEVLLRVGEPYRQVFVDDTIRNLRALPQLSVVLAFATVGSATNRVRLVVITKDVWSLRPNWNFQLTNGGFALLQAQPAETNVAGTHHTAVGNVLLDPASLTLGAGYRIPRLASTRVLVAANANVIFNRATGNTEGSYGQLITGQPLYSPLAKWAWDASASWQNSVIRRFENAQLAAYTAESTGQTVPFEYRGINYNTYYEAIRSFGWDIKHDISFGGGISRSVYRTEFGPLAVRPEQANHWPGPLDFAPLDPRTSAEFAQLYLPVNDTRVGPFLQYRTYSKRYIRVLDFETLGLQEDYRIGHDAYLRVYPSFKALGSSRDVLGIYAAVLYTVPVLDGLVRFAVESITEPEMDRLADASIEPELRIVSPTVLFGRFVYDGHVLYRYRNYLNALTYLGGDSRLRGYPTNFRVGENEVNSNLEFRTRAVDILTAQLGAVAFYDIGDAFSGGFNQMRPFQGVGAGLRAIFPQFDRLVIRADFGFPVGAEGRNAGLPPMSFFIALQQAFPMPTIGPSSVLPQTQ